jgi:hypothetical protein
MQAITIPRLIYRHFDASACGRGWKGTKGSCVRKKASDLEAGKASLKNVAKGGLVDKDRKNRQARIAFLKAKLAGDAGAMKSAGKKATKPIPGDETPPVKKKKSEAKKKKPLVLPDAIEKPAPEEKAVAKKKTLAPKDPPEGESRGVKIVMPAQQPSTTTQAERDAYSSMRDLSPTENRAHLRNRESSLNKFKGEKLAQNPALRNAPPPYPEEVAALDIYSSELFSEMNQSLRGEAKASPAIAAEIKMATSALRNMPIAQGTVYRGAALPKSVIEQYKKGSTIEELGFTSTTESKQTADDFVEYNRTPGKENVFFVINSKKGRSMKQISMLPEEEEVLFEPKTKFNVLDVKTESGRTLIYMDEK